MNLVHLLTSILPSLGGFLIITKNWGEVTSSPNYKIDYIHHYFKNLQVKSFYVHKVKIRRVRASHISKKFYTFQRASTYVGSWDLCKIFKMRKSTLGDWIMCQEHINQWQRWVPNPHIPIPGWILSIQAYMTSAFYYYTFLVPVYFLILRYSKEWKFYSYYYFPSLNVE